MYNQRRKQVADALPIGSMAVFMAGQAPYSSGDEKYPFEVERNFYYLTGLDYEDMILVILKTDAAARDILFIPPYDAFMAKWIGGRLLAGQASEISGIKDVRSTTEFSDFLDQVLTKGGRLNAPVSLWGDLSKQTLKDENPVSKLFNQCRSQQPDISIHDLFAVMYQLRSVKDEAELKLMRKAIAVTNQGIKAMMGASRPYIWENELEAYFDFVLTSEQCGYSFGSIIAAGRHATTLHYSQNNGRTNEDELVLCDVGAAYKKYCADITRTFPISGKFTARQKQIYELVLQANQMVASLAAPGKTLRQLNQAVIDFYQEKLKDTDLLNDGHTVTDYYFHGVSHMLGLQAHDIQMRDVPLQVGNVITDEPGLYLADEGIGIRIEDDLLITEDGCEVLSKDIIKTVAEIEQLMAANNA